MADSDTTDIQTSRFRRSAADDIRERTFPVVVRGYDRRAVDEFIEEVAGLVGELEGRQSRETIVQRALNEVGEETAGILQRAHETADEIAARSRAQAEGRIQRAEREAEIVRRQADEFSEKVVVDTRILWDERQRLIDDIRQLADEVLATADDAAERVALPEPIAQEEAATGPIPLQPAEGMPGDPESGFGGHPAGADPYGEAPSEPEAFIAQPADADPGFGEPLADPRFGGAGAPESGLEDAPPYLEEAQPGPDEAPTEIHDSPTAEVELDVLQGGGGENTEEFPAPGEAQESRASGEAEESSEDLRPEP